MAETAPATTSTPLPAAGAPAQPVAPVAANTPAQPVAPVAANMPAQPVAPVAAGVPAPPVAPAAIGGGGPPAAAGVPTQSVAPAASDGKEPPAAPAAADAWVAALLVAADAVPAPALARAVLAAGDPGLRLVAAALRHAAAREPADGPLARHLASGAWSRAYPLALQPYDAFTRGGPGLELSVHALARRAAWPAEALAVLQDDARCTPAAAGLRAELGGVVAQARRFAARVAAIAAVCAQARVHPVQAEALLLGAAAWDGDRRRARRDAAAPEHGRAGGCPDLDAWLGDRYRGATCLDLGCGRGELVAALTACGAVAHGRDADEALALPLSAPAGARYDVVFATGVLEPGAFRFPDRGIDAARFAAESRAHLAAVVAQVRPGGLLVLRNVTHPLPCSAIAAATLGLRLWHDAWPLCTPGYGGRSAAWRRVSAPGGTTSAPPIVP